MFCVVRALAFVISRVRPWAGTPGRDVVDVIVFPFIALIAYPVAFGDRTPDDSTVFWAGV